MRKVIVIALLFHGLSSAPALAGPIVPTNLDGLGPVQLGAAIASNVDPFAVASPPPNTMGLLGSTVYFNPGTELYTYLSSVTPTVNDASHVNTAFQVAGFNGVAGWSFGDAFSVWIFWFRRLVTVCTGWGSIGASARTGTAGRRFASTSRAPGRRFLAITTC